MSELPDKPGQSSRHAGRRNPALKPGGILLFDHWYGGAVLAQGVETRVKVVERPPLRVTRIVQSDHDETDAASK